MLEVGWHLYLFSRTRVKIHPLNEAILIELDPKIPYTNFSDKMALTNSEDAHNVDPDQIWRSSLIQVFTVCHSTKYFVKKWLRKQNKIVWNKIIQSMDIYCNNFNLWSKNIFDREMNKIPISLPRKLP